MRYISIMLLFTYLLSASTNVCENRLFSLSAYDSGARTLKISNVLKELSLKCNLSMYFKDKEAKKRVKKQLDYVNINDYTLEDFLSFLFHEANLFYSFDKEKNVINVEYMKTKTFNIDYVNVSELTSQSSKSINTGSGSSSAGNSTTGSGGSSASTDQTTISTKSTFTFWGNLKNNLIKLFPDPEKVRMLINRNASLLTITANRQDMQKAQKFIDLLMARMHKQVLIEVKLVEVSYDSSHSSGIDWSKLNLSLKGSLNGSLNGSQPLNSTYSLAYNFSTADFLKYLHTFGNVKVMSNPKILTMNNQPAVVNVGQQLSYKYQTGSVTTTGGTAAGTSTYSLGSTFIGITLYVIPEITDNNEIIMSVNPVVSSLSSGDTSSTSVREIPPDTKIKQMTSIVKVKDGEKVLIGGLISATKNKTENKVPILGDIPILGTLFSYKEDAKKRTEMFILITPKIIKNSSIPSLDDMEDDAFFSTSHYDNPKNYTSEVH